MKVLFSAHDAGGANAILPVVLRLLERGEDVRGVLAGPAERIFSSNHVPFVGASGRGGQAATSGLDLTPPDLFLAGTSMGDTVDKKILAALGGRTPSLYVLDFWLNYWQRFSTVGKKDFAFLPTKVCVMDDTSRTEMIAEGFSSAHVIVTGNPHFDHFSAAVTRTAEEKGRVLFVSQPLRAGALPGFVAPADDEYEALETLIGTLPDSCSLSIRPHPKEAPDKYARYLGGRVRLAPVPTLEEALSASGLVVGVCSPVLIQAAAAGKKVLSYEPHLAGPDPLVSNRVGVTTRIGSREELRDALAAYARGEWPFVTRSVREVWPLGATGRVLAVADELARR
jgi:hypothetical protein